ncbi:MAG: imidazolonepropionase [bacterium]
MTPRGLAVINIGQLVTCAPTGSYDETDTDLLGIIENACVILTDGRISWVGKQSDVDQDVLSNLEKIDASGCVVTPGLIDCHTHSVFAGTREKEYEMRIMGKSYLEISKAGGGIKSTVSRVREASEEELFQESLKRLQQMLKCGTTTVEIKSGYGLTTDDELKMLRVIRRLGKESGLDVVATFLGAHDFPWEYADDRNRYIDLIVHEMIPAVAGGKLADFCDVFCEMGFFGVEESERILETARRYDIKLCIHADEFSDSRGADLAARLHVVHASHLLHSDTRGLKAMRDAGTVAVVLPGVSYGLAKLGFADARRMIDIGLRVAIATDFNPGSSMIHSLLIVAGMACSFMRVTPVEAFLAITINAARALDLDQKLGSIEVGKQGDLVIFNARDYRYIFYHFGAGHVRDVIKRGEVVYSI